MSKLLTTYILILIASTLGFISNAYVIDKARDMYCCNYVQVKVKTDLPISKTQLEEEEEVLSNIYMGLSTDRIPIIP